MQLTADNFKNGFLVDDEVIAGVTQMEGAATPVYAAYISHYLTGETFAYQEFDAVEPALRFLAGVDRPWVYEAVGCSAKTSAPKSTSASSRGCASGSCGSCQTETTS
ncbi:MAG: hypothetical protein HY074_16575 [Deltaproteobacteria bacterium]|nr:hypothetical protein [Deltaproteobacteria bacterium]